MREPVIVNGVEIGYTSKDMVMKKFSWVRRILNWFWFHCPDCKGKMTVAFLDMQFDKLVYECVDCKKLWI
jgi:hypothetical protein